MRQLTRVVKPGGVVIVTTPNQLSLLSKMTLVLKNQFNAFQSGSYPAHLTALLEIDLVRMARECGLAEPVIHCHEFRENPFYPYALAAMAGRQAFQRQYHPDGPQAGNAAAINIGPIIRAWQRLRRNGAVNIQKTA